MAEGIILPLAKSVVGKIASFAGDLVLSSVAEEIKAAKSAKADLNIISEKLDAICAVIADAEERQYASNAIKIWLRDLKSVVYDIDDLLDEVATDALQRRVNKGHLGREFRCYFSSSNPLISRFVLSRKVRVLREKLDNIVAKKNDFNLTERPVEISSHEIRDPLDRCSYVHEPAIFGREAAKNDILAIVAVLSIVIDQLSVLPIVGMGGIGKTALAKLVYKDVDVLGFDLKLWACVSDKFQLEKIVEDIVKDGTGDNNVSSQNLNISIKKLHELLEGRKYFLVLDDVWEENFAKWSKLKSLLAVGKPGSVILITTRGNRVASVTGTVEPYKLDSLPFEDCWSIFKQLAFAEGEEERNEYLVEIGREIVKKCDGIPLVVISLGSLLRRERDEKQWERIKNMDSFVELRGQYDEVMSLLKLSYDKLPSRLKPCFAYLSLFRKNAPFGPIDVIDWWSALGLLQGEIEIERKGYSYFLEFASRSLLHEPNFTLLNNIYFSSCKMHDLMHDLATKIIEEEISIITQVNKKVLPSTRHLVWGCESSNNMNETTFPAIELLKAANIRSFRFGYKINYISRSFLEAIITNLCCLRILDLREARFEELPDMIGNLKHLRLLDLTNNCALKSVPKSMCKLFNLESLYLHGCQQLEEVPDDIYLLQSLRYYSFTTRQLRLGTKFHELSSMRMLGFSECKRLTSLWDDCNVGHLTSLRFLKIEGCPKLTWLPKSMKFLSSLETLLIYDCEMLDLEKEESLQGLQGLQHLVIKGVPKLKRFPHGLQSAFASLQDLFIIDCKGLVELPDWLQCFISLHRVEILDCPNVLALPREFGHLNSLQQLLITDCPHLSKRCAVPTGEDYILVQHIQEFILDGVRHTPHTASS